MNNIKAIFIDIDGTLTNDNKELTIENKIAINKLKDKNIYVVLCSGRTNAYTIKISKECNASRYVISSNGALVYDYEEDNIIHINRIPFEVIEDLWNYCLKEKISLLMNSINMRYGNIYLEGITDPNKTIIEDLNIIKNEKITQFVINSENYDKMKLLEEKIKNSKFLKIANLSHNYLDKNIDKRKSFFFDITYIGTDKGIGIKKFLESKNINISETMCFGDHINDKEMFDSVGYKVAMGNSGDDLKKLADYITLTNNESGVAYFINNKLI